MGDRKIAGLACATLALSVAVNLLAFQDQRRGSAIETAALAPKPIEVMEPTRPTAFKPSGGIGDQVSATPDAAKPENFVDVVRGIQRELNARAYDAGQPDGVPGLVTRAAIMAYEHDYGLPLTATPSEDLLSQIVLGSSSAKPATQPTSDGRLAAEADALVRSVKQQLTALGYQPGKVDGQVTAQMARAIREFEIDQKLADTGRISGPLMSRLIRLQGQAPSKPTPARAAQR